MHLLSEFAGHLLNQRLVYFLENALAQFSWLENDDE